MNFVFVLAIYKMMHGQTKEDAVHNIPYFEQKDIKTTSFPYPVGAKALEPGEYCWQVKAFINGYPIVTSEIWNFVKEMKETAGKCGKPVECTVCERKFGPCQREPPGHGGYCGPMPLHYDLEKVKCFNCGEKVDCRDPCPHPGDCVLPKDHKCKCRKPAKCFTCKKPGFSCTRDYGHPGDCWSWSPPVIHAGKM